MLYQSVEVLHPQSTYHVELLIGSKGQIPSMRGRCSLPHNVKRTKEIVLVFAKSNSDDAKLAAAAGVDHVGGAELFDDLENEVIRPTKVLSTPEMLSQVTRRLGKFLGQRGLMPTARRGGVGEGKELVQRIQEARGATDWMSTDMGTIHARKSDLEAAA